MWTNIIEAGVMLIAVFGGLIYDHTKHARVKKNRNLMEKGYGFLLDEAERDEVLATGDVEVLKPFQKPKIIKIKKNSVGLAILLSVVLGGCQTTQSLSAINEYVKIGPVTEISEVAAARCRIAVRSMPTLPGFNQPTNGLASTMALIAADEARNDNQFSDCMLIQGYEQKARISVNNHHLSNGVYTTSNDQDIAGCKNVGSVVGSSALYGMFAESAIEFAAKEASTKALALGGTDFLVEHVRSSEANGTSVSGKAFMCPMRKKLQVPGYKAENDGTKH